MMSYLINKSIILQSASLLLHNHCLFPAVAHGAYYSCYQMMKHIWLYAMGKSELDLNANSGRSIMGSHEYLTNEVIRFVGESNQRNATSDSRLLRNTIPQLKRLRTDADYNDAEFDFSKSLSSINLLNQIIPVLKKYQ
jgi:hypothetical protein